MSRTVFLMLGMLAVLAACTAPLTDSQRLGFQVLCDHPEIIPKKYTATMPEVPALACMMAESGKTPAP